MGGGVPWRGTVNEQKHAADKPHVDIIGAFAMDGAIRHQRAVLAIFTLMGWERAINRWAHGELHSVWPNEKLPCSSHGHLSPKKKHEPKYVAAGAKKAICGGKTPSNCKKLCFALTRLGSKHPTARGGGGDSSAPGRRTADRRTHRGPLAKPYRHGGSAALDRTRGDAPDEERVAPHPHPKRNAPGTQAPQTHHYGPLSINCNEIGPPLPPPPCSLFTLPKPIQC